MQGFDLPTNIRQIGGVDDRLRIYVEDYAISYLKRFAELGGDSERMAYLIGKYMVIDNQAYLFVCGAVQGKFTAREDGAETFTNESYEHANMCLSKYFEGYEIVGWVQSQPGYGTRLNPVCGDYHMNNFIKPYHCLMVIDPQEKLESFYLWEKNMSEMVEAKGYFVYYDKNRGMQDYIADNRLTGVRDLSGRRGTADEASDKKVVNMRGTGKATIQPKQNPIEKFFAVWKKSDVKKLTKKAPTEYKKMVNMLVSLSAVLFVITFIMGAGVIQADNNITRLENDLHALNNAFIYVQGRVNQLAGQVHAQSISEQQNAAVPVFAPDDVPLAQLQEQTNQTAQQTNNQQDATLQNVLVLPNEHVQGSNNQQNQNVTTPPATHPPAYNQNLPQATPRVRLGMSFEEALALSIIINEFDSYIIQRGDTLSGIVHRFYGSADLIEVVMEVNNILHPDLIMFGSELLLPRLYAHNLPEE